jgi:hypothetical protein
MEIYISRNGQQLGPYPLDEINRQLSAGILTNSDQAWYEGAATWIPLSTVPGVMPTPPLPVSTSSAPTAPTTTGYQDYKQVPWYRRSSVNSVFILLNVLSCGFLPGILVVCIIALTGDIYSNNRDEQGNVKKWGKGNKVAAFILLILYFWFLIHRFT